MNSLAACGNADWRKCELCKTYDDTANMLMRGTGHAVHRSCKYSYNNEWAKKKRRAAHAPLLRSSPDGADAGEYDHVWYWKPSAMRVVDRKGQRCRVLVRAPRMNSVLVEFEDGYTVVTSRNAVRLAEPNKQRDLAAVNR